MAQAGDALAGRGTDGLVTVALALLVAGFFVKAAIVPFHFWLADAYAVAPSPVCAVFSAAMAELGLYAIARIFWTVFSGPVDAGSLRVALVTAGVATALIGGIMSFLERHLKRMLAFATISQLRLF